MNRAAAIALALATVVAACQTGTPNGSGGPGSNAPNGSSPIDPGTTVGSPPSPTADDATPAVIDATLLEYLPETVGGVPVTEALDEAALALADPALPRIATALDVGLAIDETTGNLVTAHVVRLREGAFDDATYRQWRDSYDEGACTAAGGIKGRAEATIDERTVFVTSCVGPLRTYHVWIEDEHLLISASSVGEGRFGELLMAGLRIAR
jgi:hypothetical protein